MYGRIMASLCVIIVLGFLAWITLGPQVNFRTLRSDLARVHLTPGYRLVAEHRAGSDCHDQCSITQTWAWTLSSRRTASAACADVLRALTSAYSKEMVDANSPISAHASCDDVAILSTISSPGQGKPLAEAIVQTNQTPTRSGFLIELIACYSTAGDCPTS